MSSILIIYILFVADTEEVTAQPATVLIGGTTDTGETTVHTGTGRGSDTGSGSGAPRDTGSAAGAERGRPSTGSITRTGTATGTGRETGTGWT